MADNNVFILFEEIKNVLEGMRRKLEELPIVMNGFNKMFDIHREEKTIEWVRKQADGYDTSLKAVSDSLMQKSLKSKGKPYVNNPKSN